MGGIMQAIDWELVRGSKRRSDVKNAKRWTYRHSQKQQEKYQREKKVLCPIVNYLLDRWPRA